MENLPFEQAGEEAKTESVGKILDKQAIKLKALLVSLWQRADKRIIILAACIFVLVVFSLGIIGFGVYRFNWNNRFTEAMTRVLPYPAAMVNGRIVSYYDWQFESAAVAKFNQKKFGKADDAEVRQDVLNKLIFEKLLKQMARDYKIKVDDNDIAKNVSAITDQLGGEDALKKNIEEYFGWDLEIFKKRIIYPETLREKLQAQIAEAPKNVAETEKKAKAVLAEVKSGQKSFEDLAKQYSDDTNSAVKGGDLDWFPRGVMVKEFEDAAFAMPAGQISDLIKTQFGFHIIKLVDRKAADEKTNTSEQVRASHILIKFKGFVDYFNEYKAKAKVRKFVAL